MWVVHNLQDNEHVIIIHVQDGQTALYIASWKGHMEVVQLLLQKQSDVGKSKTVYYNTLYTFLYTVYNYISHTMSALPPHLHMYQYSGIARECFMVGHQGRSQNLNNGGFSAKRAKKGF